VFLPVGYMMTENTNIFDENLRNTALFLKKIIAVKSLSGEEEKLMSALKRELAPLCDIARLVKIPEDIRKNPLYSNVKVGISYNRKHNLVLKVNGQTNETVIINAHADTVPAAEEMFEAYEKDGIVFGRGACDDKGQIAMIYLLLASIKKSGIKPAKTLEIHIVAEEEIGGNGTLALMQEEMRAGLAIILEPTDLKILTASRGVLWFRVETRGIAGHSGDVKSVKNALKTAVAVMGVLEDCHKKIFHELKGRHPFEDFENPMPLTFGKLHSGQWPATAPKEAILEGVFGFLPGMNSQEVMNEITKSIDGAGSEISGYTEISFPLQREPSVTSRELVCVKKFAESVQGAGTKVQYSALPACCDMWFYSHKKKIPAIIFGAGKLRHAHSDNEQVKLTDIRSCALAIYNIINRQVQ
jgi:acetylornithine deacetylase/succinyl-diaminopimelate desuccinylase-like protein